MKTYEGMFLLDAGNSDFEAASEPVRNVLAKTDAEILAINPWDERRLCYEIRGKKRAIYVLTYFNADPARLAELEHNCQLDERILRLLVLRHDKLTEEQIGAETPATSSMRRAAEAAAKLADEEQKKEQKNEQQVKDQDENQDKEAGEGAETPATSGMRKADEEQKEEQKTEQQDKDQDENQDKEAGEGADKNDEVDKS
ncbi:MAG: 30S ribosomal protein S6 [Phycisphaerae bacterium]|nr:30S ribosomal protein S6 [Phycisphaerae bacterium]